MKTAAYILTGGLAIVALSIGIPYYQATISKATVQPRAQTEARTTARALGNIERFYDLASTFEVRATQAADLKAQLATATNDERPHLATEYNGARAICLEVASQYNADALKTTRADLRDARLPAELNPARCS